MEGDRSQKTWVQIPLPPPLWPSDSSSVKRGSLESQVVMTIKCGWKCFVLWSVLGTGCLYSYLILWERHSFSGMSRAPGGPVGELMVFLQVMFLKPSAHTVFAYPLHFTNVRLYDWLIEHQQPGEILYHSPGLYFPFLLKFLLTPGPGAFKPSLVSSRAPWFDQSNWCAVFWSHSVERQRRQQTHDAIQKMLGSSLLPKPPSLRTPLPPWPCRHPWAPQWQVYSLRPPMSLKF